MTRLPFPMVIFLAVTAFTLGGCGAASDVPELGKVSGTVTFDGKPLADANVEFRPVQGGRPSGAMTDREGHYSLIYTQGSPGALIGKHSVLISTARYAPQPDGSTVPIPEKIPAKYHEKTTLSEEVKAGTNHFNFDLTSK